MPGRGNNRGRRGGSVNFKPRNERESVMDRLGKMPVYPKINDRNNPKKYKFVRQTNITSAIAALPLEAKIKTLSRKFLKSYYEIFDQPGRNNLESQYSADAFFSFSATYPTPSYGRNLLQVREPENRVQLLFHDRTNIARALTTFAPTEHLVGTLSADVPYYIVSPMSVSSMQIIVTGVFRDTSQQTNPLKAFTRVFVLKQVSADKQGDPVYEIFNDLFMLQAPTPEQIKRFHHDSQIAKRLSTASQPAASTTSDGSNKSPDEMLRSIMAKTKMNKVGSRQLLQDCGWDENKSMEAFNQLSKTNQIPQEFFIP